VSGVGEPAPWGGSIGSDGFSLIAHEAPYG
jgi:hypothetical protein